MKDKKLEQEFEEYFKGIKTPDNITGDAKKHVKPKQNFLPKFVKFASIAASFVLVFAVALTVILKVDFNKKDDDLANSSAPTVPDDNGFKFYTDADLTSEYANAYSLSSIDRSLKFIENFALSSNASVKECKASYNGGKLALATAEITVLNGLSRDETKVYVEFTDENYIYDPLADYYDGNKGLYRGAEYYLTKGTAENGEPQFKLHVSYRGVKYYFDVTSSDKNAYERYLNLIVK